MRKLIIVIALLALGSLLYSRYGYLIQSVKNFPSKTEVTTDPVDLAPSPVSDPELSYLNLPEGYAIGYYAKDVAGARSLAEGSEGVVYVGTRGEGVVYALEDSDLDGHADKRYVVASGLNSPNGVAYKDGVLYVAEIHRIIKFVGIDSTYRDSPSYTVVYDKLPTDAHHGWKYLAFGPDNLLYIPIGMPCNVCDDEDRYGRLIRIDPERVEQAFEVYAYGIRNTVGFTWDPKDGSLWFTDNGRDNLGDNTPPDELNHATTKDQHFGFPLCHGNSIRDLQFGKGVNCASFQKPAIELDPHVAALGLKFVGDRLIIAEHGSWNRRDPIGYRLTSVDVKDGVASNYQVFVDGWLGEDGNAKGRPVDILTHSDGSLLVSDDFAGVIYRLIKQ